MRNGELRWGMWRDSGMSCPLPSRGCYVVSSIIYQCIYSIWQPIDQALETFTGSFTGLTGNPVSKLPIISVAPLATETRPTTACHSRTLPSPL